MAFAVLKDPSRPTPPMRAELEGEIMKVVDDQLGAVAPPGAGVRFVNTLPKTLGQAAAQPSRRCAKGAIRGDLTTIEDRPRCTRSRGPGHAGLPARLNGPIPAGGARSAAAGHREVMVPPRRSTRASALRQPRSPAPHQPLVAPRRTGARLDLAAWAARAGARCRWPPNAPPGLDPRGYLVGGSSTGVRALWDGERLRFPQPVGSSTAQPESHPPAAHAAGRQNVWMGRGRFGRSRPGSASRAARDDSGGRACVTRPSSCAGTALRFKRQH